uniref:Uncharacterized protein n=1 Tax=Spyridia filamentosa TaxID=196632 RepID=A0A1Z1MK06_SPYFI|nr:hypothetical protein [Spyridia filamentosa]ARW66155.1 hypothetical protein [Spyridia filamentosa]
MKCSNNHLFSFIILYMLFNYSCRFYQLSKWFYCLLYNVKPFV